MKKKVKDLNLNELDSICEKQKLCSKCPLYIHDEKICYAKAYCIVNKRRSIREKEIEF